MHLVFEVPPLALGQKPLTLRKTIAGIYAEFGVKTRLELLALWLGEN